MKEQDAENRFRRKVTTLLPFHLPVRTGKDHFQGGKLHFFDQWASYLQERSSTEAFRLSMGQRIYLMSDCLNLHPHVQR